MTEYLNHLKTVRDNDGQISVNSVQEALQSSRNYLNYTDIPITTHALSDLVAYKKANQQSTDIESA